MVATTPGLLFWPWIPGFQSPALWAAPCRLSRAEVGERPWQGSRAQCPHTCPHPGARASLREAKAHPNLGGNPQFGFPPAGPAGSLAARLGAIYTSLHGAERPGGKAKEVKLLWGRNDTTRL